MLCRCAFIGDPVLASAFDLVGIQPVPAETSEEAVARCNEYLDENLSLEQKYGLIMIEKYLWDKFDRETIDAYLDHVEPSIVPVDLSNRSD